MQRKASNIADPKMDHLPFTCCKILHQQAESLKSSK